MDKNVFTKPDGTWITCDECPYARKTEGRRCINYWQQMFIKRADYNCEDNLIG
jgi:hypothetical protein